MKRGYTIDDFKVIENTETNTCRIVMPGTVVGMKPYERPLRMQRWPSDVICVVIGAMLSSNPGLKLESVRIPYILRESMQLCGEPESKISEIMFSTMCMISDNNEGEDCNRYSKNLHKIHHLI